MFGGALAQVVVALAVGWVLAGALLQWAGASARGEEPRRTLEGIGLPEHVLLAIAAVVALSAVAMVVHALGRGIVFANPFVVPAVGVAIVVWGVRRRGWPFSAPWILIAVGALILVAIFVTPVLLEGTGVRAGDSSLHMGWTEQLLRGESVPPGPAPEFGRNAYPWGFHAVMAMMVRLVPGTNTLVAQEALHLLLLLGIPLGCACLARRLRPGSGWAGALCASLIAGFGWVIAEGPDFVASPLEARYGADMVAASPNSVYELFPPAFPREVGLVVLAGAGLLITLAVATGNRRVGLLAGVSTGLVGLLSVPLFLSGIVWTFVGAALSGRSQRRRMLALLAGPALAVFLLWAGPVAYNYIRYGGFVNITSRLGVEWPIGIALVSWGLLFPLACIGVATAWRSGERGARVFLGFAAAAIVMLALSRARAAFDWQLAGNATALHQGRVWPVAHLLGAGFAGAALGAGFEWLRRRWELVAALVVAVVATLGSLSLWLSSEALAEIIRNHEDGYLYNRDEFASGSFVMEAAGELGPGDIVQAPSGDDNVLGLWLFQFSGARISGHEDSRYPGNELRIRYEELAERYGDALEAGGFEADYVPLPKSRAESAGVPMSEVVAEGPFRGQNWVLVEADALR